MVSPWLAVGVGGLQKVRVTEKEDQATETKISNKVGQGNPLWALLSAFPP